MSNMPQDWLGRTAENTVFGETTVASRTDFFNIQFQYNVSTIDTTRTLTGTGAISHSQGVASIESGTGVGTSRLESRAAVRYLPGHECICHFTADFALPEANTLQRAGLCNTDNGVTVGYDGLDFGVCILRGGAKTFIKREDWNGDLADGSGYSGFVLDPQAYNIYQISYGWLGVSPITFSVYAGQKRGWIMLHSFDITNVGQGPHILNPGLPMSISVQRTTGTGANLKINTSSWRGGIVGNMPVGTLSNREWVTSVAAKAVSANTTTPIVTLKNKDTFQGLTNHVRARYATVSVAADGTKPVIFYVYKNGVLTGAVFTDKSATESVVQVDTSATAISGMQEVGGVVLQKADTARVNMYANDVILAFYPGETITFAARSTGATVVDLFLRWIEEF